MIHLPQVTIAIVDTVNYFGAINAMQQALSIVTPGRAILLTEMEFETSAFDVITIPPIKSKEGYSEFIIKELYKYIETDFVLIIQHDSGVLDEEMWDNRYMDYDIIGSLWQYPDDRNGFNGGFTLRSKRLQEILATEGFVEVFHPEDEVIGRLYRKVLENKYGIKFAPDWLAEKFSFELNAPYQKTFGFHGFFHPPFKEHVILQRTGALGDIIMCEPVVDYFSKKGFQVVLDTLPDNMPVFAHYPYRVMHISEMDERIKAKRYVLDMAYENKPQQLVIKSYYEACGIEDGETRNSKLYLNVGDNKLFEKYVVIHADDTGIPHRNIHNLNWTPIVEHLQLLGYFVVQIGKRTKFKIPGATLVNADTLHMVMFLCKGADLVIGGDSGIAQISVAIGTKTIIFFGSVNPSFRYADLSNIGVVQSACDTPHCYHSIRGSTRGADCHIDISLPPCTRYSSEQIIQQIKNIL